MKQGRFPGREAALFVVDYMLGVKKSLSDTAKKLLLV